MTIRRTTALAATATLALMLAACSGSEPEQPPVNVEETNSATAEVINETEIANVIPAPEATVNAIETPAATVEDERAPDAQMYDDADATGMTARVDRGEGSENSSAPAEADR